MSLFWKRPEPGQSRMKGSAFSSRLPKRGNSILGGKPFLSIRDVGKRIKEDPGSDIFRKTKFWKKEREKLAEKLPLKRMGRNINEGDLKMARRELGLGRLGEYKNLSQNDRKDLKKLLDKTSGSKL